MPASQVHLYQVPGLKLLERAAFTASVLSRDSHRCVLCKGTTDLAAHHILNRHLWTAPGEVGGYFLENGATLCDKCHPLAEQTRVSPEAIRKAAGILLALVPSTVDVDMPLDTWGNPILPNGTRMRGPLFADDGCQRALAAGGELSNFTHFVKYPRTAHLPWSPGASKDDVVLDTTSFAGKEVVVTVKMDGESTTVYSDKIHARSLAEMKHPSQTRVKAWHSLVAASLPPEWRFCIENVSARHTVSYENLESYFFLTSVWDDKNTRLSWDDTVTWAALLGIPTAPVLYRGLYDEARIRTLYTPTFQGNAMEGYVVTTVEGYPFGAFQKNTAKFVARSFGDALEFRAGDHWALMEVVWNGLAKN